MDCNTSHFHVSCAFKAGFAFGFEITLVCPFVYQTLKQMDDLTYLILNIMKVKSSRKDMNVISFKAEKGM